MSFTRVDALATELSETDKDGFWKDVSKINQTSNVIASSIGRISGECNISMFCKDNFSSILNSSGLSKVNLKNSFMSTLDNIQYSECGNISESHNYRPIALATIISKLFEFVLLLECEDYLSTCSNQLGLKKAGSQ